MREVYWCFLIENVYTLCHLLFDTQPVTPTTNFTHRERDHSTNLSKLQAHLAIVEILTTWRYPKPNQYVLTVGSDKISLLSQNIATPVNGCCQPCVQVLACPPVGILYLRRRKKSEVQENQHDPQGILARNHLKSSKIHQHAVKKVTQLLDFDGIGTVANAKHPWLWTKLWITFTESIKIRPNSKHPWLGYTQSWTQQRQPVEFDAFGTVANAKHPWLGYTQSWIQQRQPVEFGGFGTHGYMLYSLGYTVEYWNHQNQAKPGKGFWRICGRNK